MININLLPWRAQLEKEKQHTFIALLLIAVGVSIFICLILHLVLARQLSKQLTVNNYLLQQITLVDQQITQVNAIKQQKNDLIRRLSIIHQLQTSRVLLVAMFNNFVNILPPGIYISNLKKSQGLITIEGKARSNQQVSQLMKNIALSPSFGNPVLTSIQDNTATNKNKNDVLDSIYFLSFELQVKEQTDTGITEEVLSSPNKVVP